MAEKKQEFKCIYCENSFDEEAEYYNHREKILCMCSFCGDIFKDGNKLSKHYSEHSSHGLYKCLMCKVFTNDLKLILIHINFHREKPFKCKKCEARFCLKSDLINHFKKHNEQWECNDCKFTTKTLKDLEEHKKCHEKEKPDRFYSEDEFTPNGLQLRDRFTNETIFITKTSF